LASVLLRSKATDAACTTATLTVPAEDFGFGFDVRFMREEKLYSKQILAAPLGVFREPEKLVATFIYCWKV
jgi:hypothetical protein